MSDPEDNRVNRRIAVEGWLWLPLAALAMGYPIVIRLLAWLMPD